MGVPEKDGIEMKAKAKAPWGKESAVNRAVQALPSHERVAAYVYVSRRRCAGHCGKIITLRIDDTMEVRRIQQATGVSEEYARRVAGMQSLRARAQQINVAAISLFCTSCQLKPYLLPS